MIVVFMMFLAFLFLGVVFYVIYSETRLEKIFNKELEEAKRDRLNAEYRKEQGND